MALKQVEAERKRTTGEVPHDALKRVERRVQEILARRDAALRCTACRRAPQGAGEMSA